MIWHTLLDNRVVNGHDILCSDKLGRVLLKQESQDSNRTLRNVEAIDPAFHFAFDPLPSGLDFTRPNPSSRITENALQMKVETYLLKSRQAIANGDERLKDRELLL